MYFNQILIHPSQSFSCVFWLPMLALGKFQYHTMILTRQRNVNKAHPDVEVFCCGVDEQLNEHGYIVPGLGDAGDRQYQGDSYQM